MENQRVNDEIEIDLLEVFGVLLSRIWLILSAGLFAALVLFIGSNFIMTPYYSSTTKIYILNNVATLFPRRIITLVVCHRTNRYNDMRTGKGKGFRTPIFSREPCPETTNKNMVIISKYEVEYKKEDIFNQQ